MTRAPSGGAVLVTARRVLVDPETVLEGGGLVVQGGVVARTLASHGAVRRARADAALTLDLGEAWIVPGWVNAHAHLELGFLAGRLPSSEREQPGDFVAWIQTLLQERAAGLANGAVAGVAHAVRSGARAALANGTTCIGDIDSMGHRGAPLAGRGPRLRLYREVLDALDPARTAAALSTVSARLPRRRRVFEGLSPHAPFTVSDELLRGVALLQKQRGIPLAIHWAESADEADWVDLQGDPSGALREMVGAPPGRSSWERLSEHGLCGPQTTFIHANHVGAQERRAIAECGVHVVHCPGTHSFFGREPFPFRSWIESGVSIALGTDSLASNEALDPRREMALVRQAAPWLAPKSVLEMVTRNAAAALGLGARCGSLAEGACADFAVHQAPAEASTDGFLDALTSARTQVLATYVGGRCEWRASGAPIQPAES